MRLLIAMLLTISLLACATIEPSYDPAYERCLRKPDFEDETATACTIAIHSPRTTAEDRAFALNNRATLRQQDQAKADLDRAVTLAPGIAKLHHNRAQRQTDPRSALADLDQATRLDPNYAVAFTSRGEMYAEQKRYELAIRDFGEAIRLAPRYVHPMYNPYELRARTKEERGDRKGAAADRVLSNRYFVAPGPDSGDVEGPNASGLRAWEPFPVR